MIAHRFPRPRSLRDLFPDVVERLGEVCRVGARSNTLGAFLGAYRSAGMALLEGWVVDDTKFQQGHENLIFFKISVILIQNI